LSQSTLAAPENAIFFEGICAKKLPQPMAGFVPGALKRPARPALGSSSRAGDGENGVGLETILSKWFGWIGPKSCPVSVCIPMLFAAQWKAKSNHKA